MAKKIKLTKLKLSLISCALIFIGTAFFCEYYITTCILIIAAYFIYEIIGTDHVYYDVQKDHEYQFSNSATSEHTIKDHTLYIPSHHSSDNETIFIELSCKATMTGYLLDPFVEIYCGGKSIYQYFERGFQGKRYVNITHLPFSSSSKITLSFGYCRLEKSTCTIIATKKPDIISKKILVIAPHADDAEIAAFGVYSDHNSMIVTVTAGESEPSPTLVAMTKDNETASLLTGRLRAWDSIAIPMWAGLTNKKAINLGYLDNSLETLHLNQKTNFPSRLKKIARQFNSIKLQSDPETVASWHSLIHDLSEIIEHFNPDIIITPHPEIDAHPDHRLSTKAIQEAVDMRPLKDIMYLYYINHLKNTDRWPFGPHGSSIAPPPGKHHVQGFFSYHTNSSTQIDKACSLAMMHDLKKPIKTKNRLRYWLQEKLLSRPRSPLKQKPLFQKKHSSK